MGGWGDGSGGNVSDGERWGAADEASLARPPLTSCCAAWFLTGGRLVPVHGPGGLGIPDLEHSNEDVKCTVRSLSVEIKGEM